VDQLTAEFFLTLAERAGPGLRGPGSKALLAQLDQRYAELLAALQWFIDQGRSDEAMRLATALASFWMATRRLEEGAGWFDRALAAPGGDDGNRGHTCFHAGMLAFWIGDDVRAAAHHHRAVDIGRRAGNATVTAQALTGLARIALRTDVSEARRLCREALAVTEGTNDRLGRSNAIHVLGVAAQMAGDLVEARDWMNQRIEIAREMGNLAGVGMECGNLSMVERQLGNLERAEALGRESLGIYYRRGDAWAMPYGLSGLAAIATERGEYERAATLVGAAEAMVEAQNAAWPPDEKPHYERMLDRLPGAMGAAEFSRARAEGRALSASEAVALALGTDAAG